MPALTIVILADEDGDEFEIGLEGRLPRKIAELDDKDVEYLTNLAIRRANALKDEGKLRPTGEFSFVRFDPSSEPDDDA